MQNLTVGLVQANQIWEDKNANFENYLRLIQNTEGIDLLVLPEMFSTGFSMQPEKLAEPFFTSESITWLRNLASKQNCAVTTSLIIEENKKYFNRMVFIEPNGILKSYDKRQLFTLAKEDKHYTAGNTTQIIDYKGWKLNLQVCYDLRFPENCRNNVENERFNYDVLIYVANWPAKRKEHWKTLLKARAIENQSYLIGVNRVGIDGKGFEYSGDSALINPLGEIISTSNREELIRTTLVASELKEIRETIPFLKDRTL
ncbi:MAG: amidohydrolase [Lishizhenia sp.]